MSDLKRSGWGGAGDGRAIRGSWSATRARAPATGAAVEPETVRLLRLGRDPFPHTLSTGVPAAPALAPGKAELVRRARLGECGAVHRLCMWALRPARRIVERYLGPTERDGAEELLFGSCRRAVQALQQAPEDDRTLDFEREVRIAVRVAAGCHVLRREVSGDDRSTEETLIAYDVLASLPAHHADVLWAVGVEGEPTTRYPPGLLQTSRDALVDAYLWRALRRTGTVETRGDHLSYLTAASYVRYELTAGRRADVRAHLQRCTLCRLLAAEVAAPGASLPSQLTRAVTTGGRAPGSGWARWGIGGSAGRTARRLSRPRHRP
ncbi:hypothetical protein [Streptomyces nigrescens]|uniref:Uncharacterized protein n=1 Tax=Streptomyces nigrescens TaxID=1920 RepID=A0ABY7IYI1_STRNI|nr:hypothetical protein [Streptomyces nigrescens]WAU03745.1 hypothetical protein STRNI_001920 [Streptomyces nigrescens]